MDAGFRERNNLRIDFFFELDILDVFSIRDHLDEGKIGLLVFIRTR